MTGNVNITSSPLISMMGDVHTVTGFLGVDDIAASAEGVPNCVSVTLAMIAIIASPIIVAFFTAVLLPIDELSLPVAAPGGHYLFHLSRAIAVLAGLRFGLVIQ